MLMRLRALLPNKPYKPATEPPAGGIADGVPKSEIRATASGRRGRDQKVRVDGTDDDGTGFQTYSYDEIKAAVDAGINVERKFAHSFYGPDGARDAVRAGTDSIEHATDLV